MAYTKYSLTPANNNAAPPDGAPEGMLPSAVNDTMRDMMAQIRDVGDGIRGGTYTMTAPVITGGSITGVALSGNTLTNPVITGGSINNTPIGASTANTGAFTTLGASGVATFSAGTVSAPAITTSGDTNTGIFFPAADTIAFTEGGVEAMRIDSSANVGIGTSSPYSKLDVFSTIGDPTLGEATGVGSIRITNGASGLSSAGGLEFKIAGDSNGYGSKIQAINSSGVQLVFAMRNAASAWTERMRITNAGFVGIGTGSPDALLSVNGIASFGDGAAATPSITNFGDLNTGFWFPAADTIAASTNGLERIRIDSSGNLGIGTTDIYSRVNIQGSGITNSTAGEANGVGALRIIGIPSALSDVNSGIEFKLSGDSNGFGSKIVALSSGGSNIVFANRNAASAWTEQMRITPTGNVGIGTSSPSARLTVVTSTTNNGVAVNDGTINSVLYNSGTALVGIVGTTTNHSFALFANNGERVRIHSTGGVSIGNITDRGAGNLNVTGVVLTGGYTVATLPAGVVGMRAYVTDALAPSFGVTVAGSGAVTIPVFYNGANWIVA